MKLKRKGRIGYLVLLAIGSAWVLLTFLVQREGPSKSWTYGADSADKKALVVYNPDLFYNLDEQVCKSFATGLQTGRWRAKVATIAAARTEDPLSYDLLVFCVNTYNWAPDRPTVNYIENLEVPENFNAVAITLGSGSTDRAKRVLEESLKKKKARLLASETYWLMRPNDDSQTAGSNVQLALENAKKLGVDIDRSFTGPGPLKK